MSNKRKKILFINGHLNVGGIEKSLVDLLNWIDYSQYDVDLLLLEEKGDYFKLLPSKVNVIYKNITKAYGPFFNVISESIKKKEYTSILYRLVLMLSYLLGRKFLFLLAPIFQLSKQYDCAIAYRPGICTDLLAYTVRSKKKIGWWHHGACNYTVKAIKDTSIVWGHLDTIITVSHGCDKLLIENFSISSNKIHIIPNMIDIRRIESFAGNTNPYNQISKSINIITLGRLSEEKHIEDVIDITNILIKNHITNFKWHIIGDGELYNTILSKIRKLQLDNYIFMYGKKSNPYPYIKFADLLVHTSQVESQCITVLEAMALKTPCVVCNSIGPEEFIHTPYNGILTEKGVNNIAEGIIYLLRHWDEKDKIVEKGYSTVALQYSPIKIINLFNQLCKQEDL